MVPGIPWWSLNCVNQLVGGGQRLEQPAGAVHGWKAKLQGMKL